MSRVLSCTHSMSCSNMYFQHIYHLGLITMGLVKTEDPQCNLHMHCIPACTSSFVAATCGRSDVPLPALKQLCLTRCWPSHCGCVSTTCSTERNVSLQVMPFTILVKAIPFPPKTLSLALWPVALPIHDHLPVSTRYAVIDCLSS